MPGTQNRKLRMARIRRKHNQKIPAFRQGFLSFYLFFRIIFSRNGLNRDVRNIDLFFL